MPRESAELCIPPEAENDPESFEILRVWSAHRHQHVTVRSDLNGGAAGFGYMLAQLAHHGANLYAQREGMSRFEVLSAILDAFRAEVEDNTGDVEGRIPD